MANIPLVDLKAQYHSIKPEMDAAIANILENTAFIGGKALTSFETAFAAFQGTRRCVGCSTGTSAIFLALKALGIGPGDEVIVPAHTFIASAEPIVYVGAKPVFVDVDPVTYNIDPTKIEAAITPATKAIIPVHLYGQLAPMDDIMAIANRHNLLVIEDSAQAHAAELNGKRAGAWGRIACFSFYPGKNLGAYGDGGAICTNDDALADLILKLRDHGSVVKYQHDIVGYCDRLDGLQAAVLGVKLPHLEDWTEARRRAAARYNELLRDIPGVVTPVEGPGFRHVYHIYCIRVPGNRDTVLKELQARGIGAGIHYPVPLHLQPAFAYLGYQRGAFPCAEEITASIISLPIYAELTEEQMVQVASTLREVIHNQQH